MKAAHSTPATPTTYAAYVGLDWAHREHAVACQDAATGERQEFVLANTPETLHQFCRELGQRYGGRPVAVGFEKTRGLLVNVLRQYPLLTLVPLNPASVHAYRQVTTPSGAKCDRKDAALMLDLLVRHDGQLPPELPDDPAVRQLAALCEERRVTVDSSTRLAQELRAKLRAYYPQALTLVGDELTTTLACDLLHRWPDLVAFQQSKAATVRNFLYGHRCRSAERVAECLAVHRDAVPGCTDEATVAALRLGVQRLVGQLRALQSSLRQVEKAIAQLFDSLPDAALFRSFPGAGPALAPRLLAAFGSNRDRYPTAGNLQCASGIAPVTEQSGDHEWVHFRWKRPHFLHQTFYEQAQASLKSSLWAQAYLKYRQAHDKHFRHSSVIRALAFKWQRLMHACWKTHTPYDESRYLDQLLRHNAPLCAYLPAQPTCS